MDLEDLLHWLGLNHMFPKRLQRHDIFSVYFEKQENIHCISARPHNSTFLQKIVYFNGNCRKVGAETGKRYPHPLDLSTAVFLCCNDIARQDLVLHFWGCKHALPLVVKTEQLEPPIIYIWPMKSLIATYALDSADTIQKPVLDFKMKVVSAFRFGEQTVSKSNILNMIISKSGKEHSFFFYRDLQGTVKQLSEISDGMIESCPIFNTEDSPSLYLNLRGNCENHPDQLDFVLTASDIVILVCNKGEVSKVRSLVDKEMVIKKKLLITFFTDLSVSDEDITFAENLEGFCNQRSVANLIVALKGVMRFDWMTDVLSAIKSNKYEHSVEDLMKIAEEKYFDIDIDRIKQPIRKAKLFSDKIIQLYKEQKMACIFPVQGSESLQWCKTDLEIYKLQNWKRNEHVRTYRDALEESKQLLRLKQLNLIKSGRSNLTYAFLENLENDDSDKSSGLTKACKDSLINAEEQNEIYLRSLKLELENATRSNLNQFYRKYSSLLNKLSIDELHTAEIQRELDELDISIANNSLSISDFSREMGQIYETIASQCVNEESTILKRLTSTAVKLLLYGYQIEVMDGRSNYVPIKWVKSILAELKRTFGNIRMKVISVLGVQSSGKSTLLNIMFGSQFAEGSGRCTRGVFIYLVKVSPECNETYRADYVLVVDTEGLFSLSSELEESEKIRRKDRELATFVIGLSNVTIVNIMGENLSYLKDILPISVHAFLRMDLVGLNPKCVLLHQNVAKGNRDHLLQQTYHLETVLDEYTLNACVLENVGRKRFKDIIQFDIVKDVYYFPPLFESSDAQDIINPHFSEAVENLKKDLMAKTDGTATIADLEQHIGYIWEAVKRDNFVFEFKNTIEAKARAIIDREVCHVQWKLRSQLNENANTFISLIHDCIELDTLMQIRTKYYDNTFALTADTAEKSCSDIFLKIPSTIIGKSISKFQNLIKDSVKRSIKEDQKFFANQFETEIKKRQKEIEIIKGDKRTLCEIDNFLITNLKKEMTASSDVNQLSDVLFRRWTTEAEDDSSGIFIPDEDAISSIYLLFPTRHAKINERLEEKGITDRNMAEFLKDIPFTYWSFDDPHTEKGKASEIVADMMEFLQGMLEKLQSGRLKYGVGIFKDIVLHVRNHRYQSEGLIHTKPVFEIDLALCLCGEFIQRIKKLDLKRVSIDRPFKRHAEQYFKSRVRETLCSQTDINEAVNNFSRTIITELGHFIVTHLSQEFATYMKMQYCFLSSKQALISHLYFTLIESNDLFFLFICLNSFEKGASCCISRLFDSISGIETDSRIGPLRIVIEDYVERQITFICSRLSENTAVHDFTQFPTMKQCVDIITSALGPFLQMNNIKPFENDIIKETEPSVVITMVVANLKTESVRKNLLKTIKYQVMETEEYDKIKFETVQIISSTLIGCTESCPLCGEVCCIGQVNHLGKHRSLTHRPTGINGNCMASSNKLSSLTCWEELNTSDHNAKQAMAIHQIRENWSVSSDISIDDNSCWKYIFVTYIKEIASRLGKDEPIDIPRSWYDLTRITEMRKLSSE